MTGILGRGWGSINKASRDIWLKLNFELEKRSVVRGRAARG